MADANFRIHLGKLPLGTEWQAYAAPISCYSIELTADQEWEWCTDKDSGAWRAVAAFQREPVIPRADKMIIKGELIIWVKGATEGTLFENCVR
jgi:hypothetical protein